MKHDRFDSRNFNKKQKLRCKMCSRNSTKGSKYCGEVCEDKDKQRLSRLLANAIFSPTHDFASGADTSTSTSTVW